MCADGLNPETLFVFHRFGLTIPPMSNSTAFKGRPWGLVDVSSRGQIAQGVVDSNVIMILDHHALAEDLVGTKGPIYGDWRPWGSASTIITYRYFESHTPLPNVSVASLLLSAIVSDTLNLKSTTTTQYDRAALKYLAEFTGMSPTTINQLARDMYLAKSNVSGLSTDDIIRLDYKAFVMGDVDSSNYTAIRVGWAAAETVLTEDYRVRKEEFFEGMRAVKATDGLDFIFMGPVNLETLTSFLLLCDPQEAKIAERVWGGNLMEAGVMNTSTLVSRKADFIPRLEGYLNKFANVGEIDFGP
jgi:inorganic pyrophosphatase/exopolyphosphatase